MGATDDFVKIATQDLLGKQGPSPEEYARLSEADSPAMAEFVREATHDLEHGCAPDPKSRDINPTKILENAEDLRNAFAGSMVPNKKTVEEDKKEIIIEGFKEKAGQEAEETLKKLLKGLR